MSQRQQAKTAKADRASFFLAKPTTALSREGCSLTKDGGDPRPEEGPPSSPTSSDVGPDDRPLTVANMKKLLAELTENIQRNMTAQIQTLTTDLCKEILEVGQHTAQAEKRMDEFVEAHNSLAYKLQEMDFNLHDHTLIMADVEDRSRYKNLRIRGIPETVLNSTLNTCLLDLFHALTPETHPVQLIIDRAHRLRRPKRLPNSTARDVIVRVHFYHTKESLTLLTTTLRTQGIAYRWGYPAKLLIHYQDALHGIDSLSAGKEKFKIWGLTLTESGERNMAKISRMSPEWTPA
ncbi:Hypothetical predicted protein [Pelobates cultripes]|uniref:Uncharacterized protein n=1 Tax=Pelobates cultripes TaxID=61616 RepID=A0AAD1WRI6_PELCU|nr:Hypothetical predicted protein [Pelobates cultripes]